MDESTLENEEREQLQSTARVHGRVAAAFAIVSLVAGLSALFVRSGSVPQGVSFLVFCWAALTALSFWLSANAHREGAPIRRFLFRFAVGAALVPLAIWIVGLDAEGYGGDVMILGILAVFVGRKALRYWP